MKQTLSPSLIATSPELGNLRKYHRLLFSANGELWYEVVLRISVTWMKWHSSTSVLCNLNVNERGKSEIDSNVNWHAALYVPLYTGRLVKVMIVTSLE